MTYGSVVFTDQLDLFLSVFVDIVISLRSDQLYSAINTSLNLSALNLFIHYLKTMTTSL